MKWPKLIILCLSFSCSLAQFVFAGDKKDKSDASLLQIVFKLRDPKELKKALFARGIEDKMKELPSIEEIDDILIKKAIESGDTEWLKEILKKKDATVNHKQLFPKLNALSKKPGSKQNNPVLYQSANQITGYLDTFLMEKLEDKNKHIVSYLDEVPTAELEDKEMLKTLISVYPFYLTTQQFFAILASKISSGASDKYNTNIVKKTLNIIYHLTENHLPHGTPSTKALDILAALKSDDDEINELVAKIWIALKKGERDSQKEMLKTSWTIPESIDEEKSNHSIHQFGELSPDAIIWTVTALLVDSVSKISVPSLARWLGEKPGKQSKVQEIDQYINLSNQISNLFAILIVKQEKPKERFKMVKKLLTMAQLFKETNNLLGASLVGSALSNNNVSRLLKDLKKSDQERLNSIFWFSMDYKAHLSIMAKSEKENSECFPNISLSLPRITGALEKPHPLNIRDKLKQFECIYPRVGLRSEKDMIILLAEIKAAMKLFHSINNISEDKLDRLSEKWLPRNTGSETKAKH